MSEKHNPKEGATLVLSRERKTRSGLVARNSLRRQQAERPARAAYLCATPCSPIDILFLDLWCLQEVMHCALGMRWIPILSNSQISKCFCFYFLLYCNETILAFNYCKCNIGEVTGDSGSRRLCAIFLAFKYYALCTCQVLTNERDVILWIKFLFYTT